MKDGSTISEEIDVADAHPSGRRPFKRTEYIEKFRTLSDGVISNTESLRFLKLVQNLSKLQSRDLLGLNPQVIPSLNKRKSSKKYIF